MARPFFTCYILLRVIQNSIFVSVNITIQVKAITKVIYINVYNDMFRLILSHYQVYLCVLRFSTFVQYGSIFFFTFDRMIMRLLLSSEPLVCLLFDFMPYSYKIKLN
jgi:hypothetical protein